MDLHKKIKQITKNDKSFVIISKEGEIEYKPSSQPIGFIDKKHNRVGFIPFFLFSLTGINEYEAYNKVQGLRRTKTRIAIHYSPIEKLINLKCSRYIVFNLEELYK